jgi:hypothetical protein
VSAELLSYLNMRLSNRMRFCQPMPRSRDSAFLRYSASAISELISWVFNDRICFLKKANLLAMISPNLKSRAVHEIVDWQDNKAILIIA